MGFGVHKDSDVMYMCGERDREGGGEEEREGDRESVCQGVIVHISNQEFY